MYAFAGFALLACVALLAVRWVNSPISQKLDRPIADQWIDAIRQFGLEPVYPPQEDFLVGDVLAMITADQIHDINLAPLPSRALKLHHIDLTPQIEQTYARTYIFPTTSEAPKAGGAVWSIPAASSSVFKVGEQRTSLPLALLPSFKLVKVKAADLAAEGFSSSLGLDSANNSVVDMSVDGVETYGIAALPAEAALQSFCTDPQTGWVCKEQSVRTQLSMIIGQKIFDTVEIGKGADRKSLPRYSVELALVSRAYLARSIQTTMIASVDMNAKGSVGGKQTEAKKTSPPATPATDGAGREAASDAAMEAPNPVSAPGASTSVRSFNGSSVTVTKTMARPIVIAFRSVRWRPEK